MPLRAFWVILIGNTPTAFHAKTREELVPTLRQLQRTQTDVSLRWFERGRVWESPQAAEGAAKLAATEARERRPKDWRPGGDHRDPRARFELTRDQKRAKFKRDLRRPDQDDAPRPPKEHRAPREHRVPREQRDPREQRGPRDRHDDRPRAPRDRGTDRPVSPFGPRTPSAPPTDSRRSAPPRAERPAARPKFERTKSADAPPKNPFSDRARSDRRGGFKPPRRRS